MVGDDEVSLQLWDTGGQERFRSITRGACCPPVWTAPHRALLTLLTPFPRRACCSKFFSGYYRDAMGVLVVYDVTSPHSFEGLFCVSLLPLRLVSSPPLP